MIIACPSCDARYVVDPEKIGSVGRTVKCAKCGHAWLQTADDAVSGETSGAGSGAEGATAEPTVENVASSIAESRIGEDASDPDEDNSDADFDIDFRSTFSADREPERGGRQGTAGLPAPPRKKRRWRARVAWLVLFAVVAGVIGGTLAFKAEILASWPASQKLYALVGLSVGPQESRLGVRNVKYDYRKVGGTDVLKIEGELVNLSEVPGDVPNLRVKFLDEAGKIVKTWTLPPPERRMLPGEIVGFTTEVAAPPTTAKRIDVGLDTDGPARR